MKVFFVILLGCGLALECSTAADTASSGSVTSSVSGTNRPRLQPVLLNEIEKGVYDLSADIACRITNTVKLVTATCDMRPTWHDSEPVYTIHLQFLQPGKYRATLVKENQDQDAPLKRVLFLEVTKGDASPENLTINATGHEEDKVINLSTGQGIILKWNGIGGRCPAWIRKYEWRFSALELLGQK